jgi:hypothetical protein
VPLKRGTAELVSVVLIGDFPGAGFLRLEVDGGRIIFAGS